MDNIDPEYILIRLFKDAMRKIGRSEALVAGWDYNVEDGLKVRDQNGVFWKFHIYPELLIPQELLDKAQKMKDKDTDGVFCHSCTLPIKKSATNGGKCCVCDYIEKVKK